MLLQEQDFEEVYSQYREEVELRASTHFESAVVAIREGRDKGARVGFLGDEQHKIEFRKGELTIVAGASGHGKSNLMGQMALDLIHNGKSPVCIMSLEMLPARSLSRMVDQALGKDCTVDECVRFIQWLGNKALFLNKVGSVSPNIIYGATIVAAKEQGCQYIIIDNLMKCVGGEYGDSAMNGQKDFICTLCALAKSLGVHIFLVHHVRKGEHETDKIDKYSIRGAASITDQADNIILLNRNLMKEQEFEQNGWNAQIDEEKSDAIVIVAKQRNGDWQGTIDLWFDKASGAYCTSPQRAPKLLCPRELLPRDAFRI